jgi:hypothetical protein
MSTNSGTKSIRQSNLSPMAIVGAILAQGVIRLIEGQDLLDKLTEERVHTGVLTTKENTQ